MNFLRWAALRWWAEWLRTLSFRDFARGRARRLKADRIDALADELQDGEHER